MLFVFMTFATKQDNLNVYQNKDGNSSYTVESESETEKKVVSNTYMNTDINFSMQIPDGWKHITKDGYDTFVHSASASSIQIQVMNYYPMVNNASADSLSETYSSMGMQITEFEYMSNNSYYVIYQSQGMSGITDYIEYVIWDRQHVAKIVVTFNDENYDKLKDEIWYCLDSVSWDYEEPITDGYRLIYQLDGDFEYAMPDQWTNASSDSSFYFELQNQPDVACLIRRIKKILPEKTIWMYTGYTYDKDLIPGGCRYSKNTDEILDNIDILVDGRFIEEKKNIRLNFRGSENQRIIDMKRTRNTGKIILSNLNN